MKKILLFLLVFSIFIPTKNRAEDGEMESMGSEVTPPPVEELSPPSDSTPTESSPSAVPESMEEATFDDVSYE